MSDVIIPKSDQINADDLISGPMTITIAGVAITAGTEQPVSIDIGVPGKVYRPCKSMSRVLVAAWGPDAKTYTGRSMTLYRDPTVKWGGMEVGGIRISHLSNIDKDMTMALTATRAQRKPYTVRPLKGGPSAPPTPKSPPTPPSQPHDAPIELDPAIGDYADMLEFAIDSATTAEEAATKINTEIKTEAWAALRNGDPVRATAIKDKAMAKVKALRAA